MILERSMQEVWNCGQSKLLLLLKEEFVPGKRKGTGDCKNIILFYFFVFLGIDLRASCLLDGCFTT
jgi:hypothetical protein